MVKFKTQPSFPKVEFKFRYFCFLSSAKKNSELSKLEYAAITLQYSNFYTTVELMEQI